MTLSTAISTCFPLAFRASDRLQKPMAIPVSSSAAASGAEKPEDLLVRVGRNQDRAAFVQLFTYYAPRVKSYLMKNGSDEALAEEIVQNTFVTIWEKAGSYNPKKAAASTWIFTIARNKRIDALRKDKYITFNSDSLAVDQASEPAPDESYVDSTTTHLLHDAVNKLPEEQARLVRMSFFEDKSHGTIAKETNLPLGTVKSRLRLAMKKLKDFMKRSDET